MMELSSEQLESLLVLLAGVIAIPLTALIVAGLVKYAAKWTKDIAYYVRAYQPAVVSAVDQPGDPVNVQIDKLLDRIVKANWDVFAAKVLPAFLNALADGLASGLAESVPLPERAPDVPPQEVAQ